jgi:hypothetical protein
VALTKGSLAKGSPPASVWPDLRQGERIGTYFLGAIKKIKISLEKKKKAGYKMILFIPRQKGPIL